MRLGLNFRMVGCHSLREKVVNGRTYRLRFVLDGMRSLFPILIVVLEYMFVFKLQSCESERLQVFFSCKQDQKGTDRAKMHIFVVCRNKVVRIVGAS